MRTDRRQRETCHRHRHRDSHASFTDHSVLHTLISSQVLHGSRHRHRCAARSTRGQAHSVPQSPHGVSTSLMRAMACHEPLRLPGPQSSLGFLWRWRYAAARSKASSSCVRSAIAPSGQGGGGSLRFQYAYMLCRQAGRASWAGELGCWEGRQRSPANEPATVDRREIFRRS